MTFEVSALILAWIAILLLALAMSGLLRQVRMLASVHSPRRFQLGPAIGEQVPPIAGPDEFSSEEMVLIFIDADCAACERILPEVDSLAKAHSKVDVMFVSKRPYLESQARSVRVVVDPQAFDRYGISVTPVAVVIDRANRVRRVEPIGSVAAMRRVIDGAEDDGGVQSGERAERHSAVRGTEA